MRLRGWRSTYVMAGPEILSRDGFAKFLNRASDVTWLAQSYVESWIS